MRLYQGRLQILTDLQITANSVSAWDPVPELKSEYDISLYFGACLENDPGDGSLIHAALEDISRARSIREQVVVTMPPRE
jgi:DNA-binding phage protein